MNKNSKTALIIMISIVFVGALFYLEQALAIPYIYKTIIKLPMFIGFPFVIKKFVLYEQTDFVMDKQSFKLVIICSGFIILIISLAFIIARSFIDPSLIISDFEGRMQITKTLFVFAGLYTVIGNAFVEEYFFRGFIFQSLYKKGCIKTAYILSASLFAIYHIGIFLTWFTLPIMFIVLFGLFCGGIIFAYFVQRTGSVLGSYIIHMSADLIIVIIGIFGIGLFA